MKPFLFLGLVILGLAPAQAQIFRPEAVSGAALGAIAGAIIGNNSGSLGHDGARGAAWGAGLGLLLGAAAGDANADPTWRGTQVPFPVIARGPVRRTEPYYANRGPVDRSQPDYRGSGLFWGALTGAIIGNNSRNFGHRGWEGAAWGAGIGYVLGAVADEDARVRMQPAPVYVQAPAASVPVAAQPQQITIINNYYNTPATAMTGANNLFGRN